MMEKLTKAMSLDPQIAKFIQEMIRRSRLHVGLFARRARNVLARANGNEPEPGCGRGRGIKRWLRYHRRVA
jgi:hypothetical protein